jgi:hypothetical protein
MYTKLCNIHHYIVSICRSMALIFVTSFCSLWQPSYISDAIRLQMRLNLTLIVLPGIWNDIDWLYCISRYVLYIYTGFIFTRVSNYFSLIMNSEITSLTYSYTERLHIFSSILIIVTSNSRNASKFILFSM